MAAYVSAVLRVPLTITNPYLYATKAEVVAVLVRDHARSVDLSVSCWRTGRGATAHCGDCIPCLIRRIALEYHGHPVTGYGRDLFAEDVAALPAEDSGRRNLTDLLEFASWFASARTVAEVEDRYPELVSDAFDATQAVAMYQRFGAEALGVISRYPGPGALVR
jgi:hypothetical protein